MYFGSLHIGRIDTALKQFDLKLKNNMFIFLFVCVYKIKVKADIFARHWSKSGKIHHFLLYNF